MIRYLSYFFNVRFEEYATIEKLNKQGFEVSGTPFGSVQVEDRTGQQRRVDLYHLVTAGTHKGDGAVDPNLALGKIGRENMPVTVKYFQIDPILKKISYFTK